MLSPKEREQKFSKEEVFPRPRAHLLRRHILILTSPSKKVKMYFSGANLFPTFFTLVGRARNAYSACAVYPAVSPYLPWQYFMSNFSPPHSPSGKGRGGGEGRGRIIPKGTRRSRGSAGRKGLCKAPPRLQRTFREGARLNSLGPKVAKRMGRGGCPLSAARRGTFGQGDG